MIGPEGALSTRPDLLLELLQGDERLAARLAEFVAPSLRDSNREVTRADAPRGCHTAAPMRFKKVPTCVEGERGEADHEIETWQGVVREAA